MIHFSGSLALHVNFAKSVLVVHSLLSLRQKLILQEIFWLPFPALLNEQDLKENLKSGKNITKSNHIRAYLKSDVLSMVADVLMAEITEAKHWFSMTSTFFEVSLTSITFCPWRSWNIHNRHQQHTISRSLQELRHPYVF